VVKKLGGLRFSCECNLFYAFFLAYFLAVPLSSFWHIFWSYLCPQGGVAGRSLRLGYKESQAFGLFGGFF